MLRPLEYYKERKAVKDAGLTTVEIVMIIMCTGPMFQVRAIGTWGRTCGTCVCVCVLDSCVVRASRQCRE